MASPQESHDKIISLGLDQWDTAVTSIPEAQKKLSQLRDFQSNLWEIKREIKANISVVWDTYREESKDSIGDSIVAAFIGKQRSYRIRKQTREQPAKNRDQYLLAYYEVESNIDDLLKQLDRNANRLRISIDELKAEEKTKKQRVIGSYTRRTNKPTDYNEYIKSPEWREKAEEAKARTGNRCQVCNRSRAEVQLDAHHRTYQRLGNELPEDITVLCRECHQLYEDTKKAAAIIAAEVPTGGFCIRCKQSIKLDPQAPYCYSCFKVWKRFDNSDYQEKCCHICGKENPSTMFKPACYECYRQYRDKLQFQNT